MLHLQLKSHWYSSQGDFVQLHSTSFHTFYRFYTSNWVKPWSCLSILDVHPKPWRSSFSDKIHRKRGKWPWKCGERGASWIRRICVDWVEALGFQFAAVGPELHHSLRKFMLHGFVHLPTDFNCFNVLSVSNCNHITILHILSHTIPFSVFV